MSRRWSKLKSRVESLWVPTLPMAIHANVWVKHATHWDLDEPRHWIVLDKTIIWDFPGPFMRPDPPRGRRSVYWEDAYGWGGGNGKSSVIATLLHHRGGAPVWPKGAPRWEVRSSGYLLDIACLESDHQPLAAVRRKTAQHGRGRVCLGSNPIGRATPESHCALSRPRT